MKALYKHIRLVNPGIIQKIMPWITCYGQSPKKNSVYLSFDDGPYRGTTEMLLEILAVHQVPALFFLRGDRACSNQNLVQKIHEGGHVIGNHGYSHTSLMFKPKDLIIEEIECTNRCITAITGEPVLYFRPPYGRFDPRFKSIMHDLGMQLVLWSLLSYDFSRRDNEQVCSTVEKHIRRHSILVFHDGLPVTAERLKILPDVIQSVRDAGYSFKHFN